MNDERFFKRLEDQGFLVNTIASLGWGFWCYDKDGNNLGYMDEQLLRKVADEIERRNKPFWDEYEKYCAAQDMRPFEDEPSQEIQDVFPD